MQEKDNPEEIWVQFLYKMEPAIQRAVEFCKALPGNSCYLPLNLIAFCYESFYYLIISNKYILGLLI